MPTATEIRQAKRKLSEQLRKLRAIEKGLPVSAAESYEEKKERSRQNQVALVRGGQEIGDPRELTPVEKRRRTIGRKSFRKFCEQFFPESFTLAWSDDHLRVISAIERAVKSGGLFALAMPRGSGKTTLARTAAIWAILYGYCRYVCVIAATATRAEQILDGIKTALRFNARLYEHFPVELHGVVKLEGEARRCIGQRHNGEPTQIVWQAKKVVFPTMHGRVASMSAGAVLTAAGLTGGEIRGQNHTLPDGKTVLRPDLVLCDDPQTRESAASEQQTNTRVALLNGDVLGMAGPGRKIAGILPCTVIAPDDLAEQILNRERSPEWQGERMQMIYKFPAAEDLWEQYAEIRFQSLREGGDGGEATAFYEQHREAMDAESLVAWPARKNPDELSGLQHAMNLKLRDEFAFWSEYQNEPKDFAVGDTMLTADQIANQVNGVERGMVPLECDVLTAHIDVHEHLLYYVVAAWSRRFDGSVVDYGVWPEQRRSYFSNAGARFTMASVAPAGTDLDGAIWHGLETLAGNLFRREWRRMDDVAMRIRRCLIDANWGRYTDLVYKFCRESPHAASLLPAHGKYVGAAGEPIGITRHDERIRPRPGEEAGLNWMIRRNRQRVIRHIVFDANFWKSFIHDRLRTADGSQGCLRLFGRPRITDHKLFADHLTAEHPERVESKNRVVDEWRLRPGRENHFLDNLVGSAVAASVEGVSLMGTDAPVHRRQRSGVKLSEVQRRRGA